MSNIWWNYYPNMFSQVVFRQARFPGNQFILTPKLDTYVLQSRCCVMAQLKPKNELFMFLWKQQM